MSTDCVRERVDEWDTLTWQLGIQQKSTLYIYREYKRNVREETWFYNSGKANLMMRARSNTLKLGWREFGLGEVKICKMCGLEDETLKHFLILCPSLQEMRNKYIELQWPPISGRQSIMAEMLLLTRVDEKYYIEILWNLWNDRREILKRMSV